MLSLEHQVNRARRRLLMNRWLGRLGLCLSAGAGAFVLIVLAARVGGFEWPLLPVGMGLLAATLVVSLAWTALTADSPSQAAVALDRAVGLKERVSSGLFCRGVEDPFARAVCRDAARTVSGISVRVHMPLRWPGSLTWGSSATVLSLWVFWLWPTMDLFGRQAAERQEELATQQAEVQRDAVLTQVARLKMLEDRHPVLKENEEFETEMDTQAAKLDTPMDARREKIKKLENLMDSVQKQQENEKYESIQELRKMFRRLQEPQQKASPVSEVADALSKADFKQARGALNRLQDELAKHEQQGNREQVEQLQKQLEQLGQKIEKLSTESKKLQDTLQQVGVDPKDMKRMLENLSKKDFDAVRDELSRLNLSPEQIEKLLKQMTRRRMAEGMAKDLGAALARAAQSAGAGDPQGSQAAMSVASDMLSEAEQLQQELAQLESAMAALGDMKNQAACAQCQGAGCSGCGAGQGGERRGRGMGRNPGQGQGGLAPEQQTAVGFKTVRTPVHSTPGSIIGEFLIKGSQFKRDSAADFSPVLISAEKDLSQAIARDKIPPYARDTVKQYFARGHQRIADEKPTGAPQDTTEE